jgi:hypothetical protein
MSIQRFSAKGRSMDTDTSFTSVPSRACMNLASSAEQTGVSALGTERMIFVPSIFMGSIWARFTSVTVKSGMMLPGLSRVPSSVTGAPANVVILMSSCRHFPRFFSFLHV